jgi:hypothetical protein
MDRMTLSAKRPFRTRTRCITPSAAIIRLSLRPATPERE